MALRTGVSGANNLSLVSIRAMRPRAPLSLEPTPPSSWSSLQIRVLGVLTLGAHPSSYHHRAGHDGGGCVYEVWGMVEAEFLMYEYKIPRSGSSYVYVI